MTRNTKTPAADSSIARALTASVHEGFKQACRESGAAQEASGQAATEKG
jgi:hypothetical protein